MRYLCAGLSRTGTKSMAAALAQLGLRTIHFDLSLLGWFLDCPGRPPAFRGYDHIDAACDLPAALFYREFLDAYPQLRVILTVRDEDAWWHGVQRFFAQYPLEGPSDLRVPLRRLAYGDETPHEALYRKRFREHYAAVRAHTPPDRLLVMNVTEGEGWEPLCAFLDLPVPDGPFPRVEDGLPLSDEFRWCPPPPQAG